MHRLWRYDVFRSAQNDVVPLRVTMMRCLPLCARRHTSLGEAVIIGVANIICRRQTSLKKDQVFRLGLFSGWGTGIQNPCARKVYQNFIVFCTSRVRTNALRHFAWVLHREARTKKKEDDFCHPLSFWLGHRDSNPGNVRVRV